MGSQEDLGFAPWWAPPPVRVPALSPGEVVLESRVRVRHDADALLGRFYLVGGLTVAAMIVAKVRRDARDDARRLCGGCGWYDVPPNRDRCPVCGTEVGA